MKSYNNNPIQIKNYAISPLQNNFHFAKYLIPFLTSSEIFTLPSLP